MRSYLTDDERREYLVLVAELGALEEDIDRTRATARRAAGVVRLELAVHPEPLRAAVYGEHVRLADGGEIIIRPIEPGDARDLAVGLQRLGALSRFRRFRAPVERLSADELSELTDVDHVSHEALVAFDAATGDGIGVARFIRVPEDPAQAEITCVVLDRWQHRGVGTALAERLAARARAVGIERFTALTIVGNEPARRLMAHVADSISEHRTGGIMEISGLSRRATS